MSVGGVLCSSSAIEVANTPSPFEKVDDLRCIRIGKPHRTIDSSQVINMI